MTAPTLAALIAEHAYTYPDSFCNCGAHMAYPWRDYSEHLAHVIAARLTDPAMVEAVACAIASPQLPGPRATDLARAALAAVRDGLGVSS